MKRTTTTALALVLATATAGAVTGTSVAAPPEQDSVTTCSEVSTADTNARTGRGPRSGGGGGAQAARSGAGGGAQAQSRSGSGRGAGVGSDPVPEVEDATVSSEVAAQLLYLVEEEKFAGDVYEVAGSLYGDRVFGNIAAAEDRHTDAVRELLDRYDLGDPSDTEAGVFTDAALQRLYDALSARVAQGRDEAVAVGVDIEERDIKDLEELLSADLPADVAQVAENLLAGSQRHLAAFQRQA